ncbi:class I SAM-dependent methyltransferase [Candidatus Magnetobacterium casense]|uniref:Methyltransferase domain-containing protein n=1 Tax=Candidatus Magnetobacterium casense TaxID=1455061 RepID=A0ABS6S2K6_9BACT|nr:methyltransferase domain-containing protein [Candidatus Magnetobacterium casensis]MBV6343056.1 methyltransferase domain-containing protein [Candidatus Magnetobacterium casensis]
MKNIVKLLSFNTFIPVFYPALMLPLRGNRKKAINMLNFNAGDRVLVPGVGTGHDLSALPKDVVVEGVDISDVMLGIGKLKIKAMGLDKNVRLKKMDAEDLYYDDNTFDKAILSLFLTVVFNPKKAFAEVVRVLKPGGQILVYDHLFREGDIPANVAKPIDAILSYGFASVTRNLDDIIEGQPVTIDKVTSGDPVGFMKAFVLKKNG